MVPSLPDLDALLSTELKALVIALLERVTVLERTVTAQRDEITRLKGGPGRPTLKPHTPGLLPLLHAVAAKFLKKRIVH